MNNTERMALWLQFLERWSIEKIKTMTLEEYVSVGDQDTFTYWLETKVHELGSIKGSPSTKFGIYHRKSAPKPQSGITHGKTYTWYSKFGNSEQSSFIEIKARILAVITAAQVGDLSAINYVDLAPMFKWKIAFLYQDKNQPCLINVFSEEKLKTLIDSQEALSLPSIYQGLIQQKGETPLLDYGEQCWTKANERTQVIRNEEVVRHFIHKPAFRDNHKNWPDETLTEFCQFMRFIAGQGLDIFTTKMDSGDSIRIGRKEVGDTNAKEVFATFEPQKNTIKYAQRYLHRDAYLTCDMSDTLLKDVKKSKHVQDFNAEYPIDRKVHKPNDYFGESYLDNLPDNNVVAESESTIYTVDNMSPLNQILYGPPGTGKTYHSIEAAVKAAEPNFTFEDRETLKLEYERLVAENRIRFVTFHQSYGYEEFVEGLRAKTNDNDQISYAVESGIFKTIAEQAHNSKYQKEFEINSTAKVWKISIDGTGQSTVRDDCFKRNIAAIGWGETGDLQSNSENEDGNAYYESLGPLDKSTLQEFSQGAQIGDLVLCIGSKRDIQAVGIVSEGYQYIDSGTLKREGYCHTLPVNWLVTDININFYELNGNKDFTQKTFYHLWRFNAADVFALLHQHGINLQVSSKPAKSDNYVLIIDEINRGNISKIFGELITLIEPSKRAGEAEALELVLPYSGSKFSIPNNLHIIGTMNTADRSLAMMDTALRRRFDFVEMMPNTALFNGIDVNGIDLERMLTTMNKRIEVLYDREHTLGHAFFMPVKALVDAKKDDAAFEELKSVFKNKIIPLLEEYFFEDWNKIRLVLGDNQKDESLRFITENKQSYDDIFGSNHGLDSYETENTTYALAPFDGSDSVWDEGKAYIGIYSPSSVNTSSHSNTAGNE